MFEKPPENFEKADILENEEEKEKREIKAIEQMPLDFDDRESLLLVYLKEKPAAFMGAERLVNFLREGNKWETLLRQIEREKIEIQENLDKIGLFYEFRRREIEPEDRKQDIFNAIGYDIFVSYKQKNLNRLIRAREEKNNKEIGLALGYPKSAVEGFSRGELFDKKRDLRQLSKKEKDELRKEGVFKFLLFKPSKNHWKEEIELARKHQRVIREKSPRIYNEASGFIEGSGVRPKTRSRGEPEKNLVSTQKKESLFWI